MYNLEIIMIVFYFLLQDLTKAFGQVRVHVFIQCYTLIFIPLTITCLVKLLTLANVIDAVILNG